MKDSRIHFAALLALLSLAMTPAGTAAASRTAPRKAAPRPVATIARVADRRVDEADIQRAALVLGTDPLKTRQHAAWRKKLLDLCVDRELLALEAQRLGLLTDEVVKQTIDRRSASALYEAIRDQFLVPAIVPTAAQIDTARAGGLFRRAKLSYVLSVTDRKATFELLEAIKHGADFDSIAALYSVHPSASHGGEIGWRRVGDLNPASWREFQEAKPGDLLGPYVNAQAHEFYRVESLADPTDDEIRDAMMKDPLREMRTRYELGLLQKYHFRLVSDAVSPMIFAAATEKADSILATLDANGLRPKRDIHPALGILATLDGDSISYRDLAASGIMTRDEDGKARIEDSKQLLMYCSAAAVPRLVVLDARARGVDRQARIARQLRLIREEVSTRAMVARAVPAPDSAAARAYYQAHLSSYQRPAARRSLVAVFASQDTARLALARWNRKSARDSILLVDGFRRDDRTTARTVFQRWYGEIPLYETDGDPISAAVRALPEGQIAPLIETPNGYAIAQVIQHEPPRAWTFEEARIRAFAEAREDAENAWVVARLGHLRTATPARTEPALLNAVRLGLAPETGGNRR